MAKGLPMTTEMMLEAKEALDKAGGNKYAAAKLLKIHSSTYTNRLEAYYRSFGDQQSTGENKKSEFTVMAIPDGDIDVEDLVDLRIKQFAKKKDHEEAVKLIHVDVKSDGVIGILFFGDPHVDDDGTDLETLRAHSDLTKQEGIWGASVGDVTNNWVGRLARLYANQTTSAEQAWRLAEWFVGRTRWLFLVSGNHDQWSGAGDPISWMAKQASAIYQPSEARINLRFPNGSSVIINCRHDFPGNSQWNPAHAQMKSAQMGYRDHLMISGHKHTSGYGVVRCPSTNRVCHAVQVASYKTFDSFAKEKGFRNNSMGPACMAVIDPKLDETHPDHLKIFWDPFVGAEYVAWRRK
jgi:hypothetical protein